MNYGDERRTTAFAACHIGKGSDAGTGNLFVKSGSSARTKTHQRYSHG